MPITVRAYVHKTDTRATLPVKQFFFPCGEVGVKLETIGNHRPFYDKFAVTARIQNSTDVMALVMVTDAIRQNHDNPPIDLNLTYLPYARQDRVCNPGESFSLKAFASIINGIKYNKVILFDPHSDVAAGVFDRVSVISQKDIVSRFREFNSRVLRGCTFVSPDAGANKKTSDLAKYFAHSHFIRADKLRNLEDGKIIETIVYADDLTGQDIVIADDICDKGGTFILLAEALKKKGARNVILYVTHGIFNAGTDVLYKGGIDEIYTTNSFYEVYPGGISDKVVTLDLNEKFVL